MKDIPFTFGIITGADQTAINEHLPAVLESIRKLNIPEHEIIIVGEQDKLAPKFDKFPHLRIIAFNERAKSKWITRKKNLITEYAKFENIVYSHDYIAFDESWYNGFKDFGNKFDVCVNQIRCADKITRFRDWVLFPYHHAYSLSNPYARRAKELWEYAGIENNESMIPYDEVRLIRYQYISGSYWIAKKRVMLDCRLNESLVWGQGEDCAWSIDSLNKGYKFSMNQNSMVYFLKQKQDAFGLIRPEVLNKCIEFIGRND